MTDTVSEGPSLIKLGKLANSKEFDKLEGLWMEALNHPGYTWNELVPIAGQVGRQGSADRAEALLDLVITHVEEKSGSLEALRVVRKGAEQLPSGKSLVGHLKRLYLSRYPDFAELPELLELVLAEKASLGNSVLKIELYVHLQVGCFAVDRSYLVPGMVEMVDGETGNLRVLFQDRRNDYEPATVHDLKPRSDEYFPAMVLYAQDKLRDLAGEDAVAFVKLALNSNRDGKI